MFQKFDIELNLLVFEISQKSLPVRNHLLICNRFIYTIFQGNVIGHPREYPMTYQVYQNLPALYASKLGIWVQPFLRN